MPSLLSDLERAFFSNVMDDVFDTFARTIIVYKEPTKVQQSINTNNFVYGFGDEQAQEAYTYIDNTGVFPAKIAYSNRIENDKLRNFDTIKIPEGCVSIAVKTDGKDFINNGKTDKIVVDGNTFYLDSLVKRQPYFDSDSWIFILKPTQ